MTSDDVSYVYRNKEAYVPMVPAEELESASRHDDALSMEQAAQLLRIGVDAMRELVILGEVPALSLNRKHWVLLRSHLLEFIKDRAEGQQETRRETHQVFDVLADQALANSCRPRRAGRQRRKPVSLD